MLDFLFRAGVIGFLINPVFLWLVINVIVYLATPLQEKRLDLAGEEEIDSLRTWCMSLKQNATLTNMKLYQNAVLLFGKKQRAVVIPLDSIDSVQISSGRNYVWLALSLSIFLSLLYGNYSYSIYGYDRGDREPWVVTLALVLAVLFFGLFWLSGTRRIVVRSETEVIVVDATTMNTSFTGAPISDARVFGFANRIQSLILHAKSAATSAAAIPVATPSPAPAPSGTVQCASCSTPLVPGSKFCEACGIPV